MIEYTTNRHDMMKVGFIFSYPRTSIDHNTGMQLNKLLARLNQKYPNYFPYCQFSKYPIIFSYIKSKENPNKFDLTEISEWTNLQRIRQELKQLSTIICFGEKGHYALKKVQQNFNINLTLIKTKDIPYTFSRHIKLMNQNHTKRVRTDYHILDQFKEIEKSLKT